MPQKSGMKSKSKLRGQSAFFAELLESRQLLSATNPLASPVDAIPAFEAGHSNPNGFSATQIKSAYGISNISFGGTAGNGTGQIIAIVAAYDNPKFVSSNDPTFSTSDLHEFDTAMGLPDPPSFTKYDQTGGIDYPPVDPDPTNTSDWENEIALDVEWSHAIAPDAGIALVECNSTSASDLIGAGVHFAASLPGVSVVSMSFTINEFSVESNYDSDLETPTGHQGVTFVAASGDNGNGGGYPAMSPNVVAVGDTSLTLSGNSYGSEVGQNDSGGGISQFESKPTYQFNTNKSSTFRTTPDVSFDGNPNTGVSVYDSYNGGSAPWYELGGTSFSAPAWAAMIAIADQGRVQLGLTTLDGASQTLPRLYTLNSSDFHDVTSGNNGNAAGSGYDLVTGLGTPIAQKLVPDLAGGNTVSGAVFTDSNGNGTQDSGESGIAGQNTYIDLSNSGVLSGVDPNVSSSSSGTYTLADLPGGTYRLRENTPSGATLTVPTNYYTVTLGFGQSETGKNFGYQAVNSPQKLAYIQQPSSVVQGSAISPAVTVEVEDALGNIVSSDNSAVTLSVAGGTGTLGGTLTENAVNGIATFSDITISTPGAESIKASDGSITDVISNDFVVSEINSGPLVPAKLDFGQPPTGTTVGNLITPAVTVLVEDANGALVTTDDSPVTLTIGSGTASLGGTTTVTAVNGVAIFNNLTLSAAETTVFTATDGSLTDVVSSPIIISPGLSVVPIPAQLAFTQQPTDTQTGSVIAPAITVEVLDSNGKLVDTDASAVTLSIAAGAGTLGGTVTVNAVGGVATFSDITFSEAGNFTLNTRDGQLNSATSQTFSVTVPGNVVPTISKSNLPAIVIGGSKLHSTVSVSNLAQVSGVGTLTTYVYASQDGVITQLGSVSKKMTLKAGKAYPVAVSIKALPANLVGSYSVLVRTIDTSGNSFPSALGQTFTVAKPVVTFTETFSKITLASALVAGSKTNGVAVVKLTNSGNVASSGASTIGIYASSDGTPTGATLIASVVKTLKLAPKGSASVAIPIKLIPTLNGSYQILTEVSNAIAGASSASSSSSVEIAPAFVSISTSIVSAAPTSVRPGGAVTIALSVTNSGNSALTDGEVPVTIGLSLDGKTAISGATNSVINLAVPASKTVTFHIKCLLLVTTPAGVYFPIVTITQGTSITTTTGMMQVTVT